MLFFRGFFLFQEMWIPKNEIRHQPLNTLLNFLLRLDVIPENGKHDSPLIFTD